MKNRLRVVTSFVGPETRTLVLFSKETAVHRRSTTVRRFAAVIPLLSLAALLGYLTVRNFAIETLLEKSLTRNTLMALIHMAPNNAYVNAALGRLCQYSAADFDPGRAIKYYRNALAINPYDVSTWQNLARAYEALGDVSNAKQALHGAGLASRSSASVHWTNANFLVRNDPQDTASILSNLKRIIELDPNSLVPALKLSFQAGIDLKETYRSIVPIDPPSQIASINYFFIVKSWDAAALAWDNLCHSGQVFGIEQTLPYIDALIANDRLLEAQNAWFEALSVTHYLDATTERPALEPSNSSDFYALAMTQKPGNRGVPAFGVEGATVNASSMTYGFSRNHIFNPDFRRDPLNGGFDWRVVNPLEPPAGIDREVFLKNHQSLRVDFTGKSNMDLANLYQFVPVRPSTRYDFTAWLKSEALSTDRGVFFEVFEISKSNSSKGPWRTAAVLGTTDWTGQSLQFTTGPETHLVQVRLRRLPTSKIENLIRGRVWIGSVSLNEKPL